MAADWPRSTLRLRLGTGLDWQMGDATSAAAAGRVAQSGAPRPPPSQSNDWMVPQPRSTPAKRIPPATNGPPFVAHIESRLHVHAAAAAAAAATAARCADRFALRRKLRSLRDGAAVATLDLRVPSQSPSQRRGSGGYACSLHLRSYGCGWRGISTRPLRKYASQSEIESKRTILYLLALYVYVYSYVVRSTYCT